MNLNIRPVRIEDARQINEIRVMDGVRENIMAVTSERVTRAESMISGLTPNDHMFVAEVEENGSKKVVGVIGLNVNQSPRARHSASIGIMIHKDYQGKGIGRALLNKVIDLADNWLMLVRLELGVFTDNERALNLYKSLGFEIEGTKRCALIRNGKYEDEYLMSRIKLN
jgi:L-phenylalanine/L-methionine N-acetyltransferase